MATHPNRAVLGSFVEITGESPETVAHLRALDPKSGVHIDTSAEFGRIAAGITGTFILLASTSEDPLRIPQFNFVQHLYDGTKKVGGMIYFPVQTSDDPFDEPQGILLIEGKEEFRRFVINNFDIHNISIKIGPRDSWKDIPRPMRREDSISHAFKTVYKYYSFGLGQLPGFIRDKNVLFPDKIISIYGALFPHLRYYLKEKYTSIVYSEGDSDDPPGYTKLFITATAVGVLGPAFRNPKTASSQIFRRVKAACAGVVAHVPTFKDIRDMLDAIVRDYSNTSIVINDIVGRTVALDKHWKFDPYVKVQDLLPLDTYDERFKVGKWILGLIAQARLVFQMYQSKSLNFGIAIYPLLKDLIMSFGGEWRSEAERMGEMYELLRNRPYIGCVGIIPTHQQVATYPILIYLGIKYHEKCLPDSREFVNYNIERISSHAPNGFKSILPSLIPLLPSVDIQNIAVLATGASSEFIETIVNQRQGTFREELFKHMVEKKLKGAWYDMEFRSRQREIAPKAKRAKISPSSEDF